MKSYELYNERYRRAYQGGLEFLNPHTLDPRLLSYLTRFDLCHSSLLELGCGEGFEARQLAELGFTVTALDLSYHAIDKAKSKNLHSNVSFDYCDILTENIQEKYGSFDLVYDIGCFHVFGTTEQRVMYFQSIRRALIPQGFLYIRMGLPDSEWLNHNIDKAFSQRLSYNTFYDLNREISVVIPSTPMIEPIKFEELQSLVDNQGFELLEWKIESGGRVFPVEQTFLLQLTLGEGK